MQISNSKDNSEYFEIISEGQSFFLQKHLLLSQVQSDLINEKMLTLPDWVAKKTYLILERYLKSKDITIFKQYSKDTAKLIQILRLTDYLVMNKFHDIFINQIIIPALNDSNCVVFLEETHKKLRNLDNGSECWYGLLNASINYLSNHMHAVFQRDPQKVSRLHEKIINEVLDRVVRIAKKNDPENKNALFSLIMQSKRLTKVDELCHLLRNIIDNKKINPKIHAKLSWKLQDIANISEKKTKIFKFLDLQWYLSAERNPQTNDLQVSLHYCPIKDEKQQQKMQIGVFYIKLIWLMDDRDSKSNNPTQPHRHQSKISTSYIKMYKNQSLPILHINDSLAKEIGRKKIELSIFCNMEQVYTFIMNYLVSNSQKVKIDESKMNTEELKILIAVSKDIGRYSQAIRWTKFLHGMDPIAAKECIEGYPLAHLSAFQIESINQIRNYSSYPPELLHYSSEYSSRPQSSVLSRSDRKSEEKPASRGRLRKIFAASPNKPDPKAQRKEEIMQVTSIKNYLYDKNSDLYHSLL